MRKKIIIVLLFVVIVFVGYNYVFQNHRNIQLENASYKISALTLANEFQENLSGSELKYLDKTIQVSGKISELSNLSITLDETVYCQFLDAQNLKFKLKENIQIKGRFIGYDDLLEQIKLDQCHIIN
ncbi:OB-fold putative lipoprotein [Hanstruepera marina]|uniref:OB-fold putative lipoprotein n=1 Tax=Hanstruepera marina TaxID=2873265 RepID=UPI001CA613F2|nr:OB-fold putative lipoprotein [Hanstruepera marina]